MDSTINQSRIYSLNDIYIWPTRATRRTKKTCLHNCKCHEWQPNSKQNPRI